MLFGAGKNYDKLIQKELARTTKMHEYHGYSHGICSAVDFLIQFRQLMCFRNPAGLNLTYPAMNAPRRFVSALSCLTALFALAGSARAQNVTTDPVGAITLTLKGGSDTFVSLPF